MSKHDFQHSASLHEGFFLVGSSRKYFGFIQRGTFLLAKLSEPQKLGIFRRKIFAARSQAHSSAGDERRRFARRKCPERSYAQAKSNSANSICYTICISNEALMSF